MKLYLAWWRQGLKTSTVQKPSPAPDTDLPPELVAGSPLLEWWIAQFWEMYRRWPNGTLMTWEQQRSLITHFLKQGVLIYGLQGAALKFFVGEKLALIVPTSGVTIAAGFLVYIGLLYLGLWLLNPTIKTSVSDSDFGTKWLMRYEGRVWWAKWTGFFDYDMPIFEQLDEIGDVIAFETRGGIGDRWHWDMWLTLDSWTELKGGFPVWNHYTWTQILPLFQGLCVQVSPGFYGLRKSYHSFMPPVSEW